MLGEHEIGRTLLGRMRESLEAPGDRSGFAQAAREYSAFLRSHIDKENGVLFPMGERLLDSKLLEDIHGRFQAHEATVMGEGRHEELHRMLEEFVKKYPPRGK